MSNLLPPPPPPPPPTTETWPWETPSSVWYTPRTTPWRTPKNTQSTPLNQMVLTKPTTVQINGLEAEPGQRTVFLQQPRSRKTKLWIWCVAGLCFLFSLSLIFFGIATLIVFLSITPRSPVFDISNANLHTVYFDSSVYFNGDLTMLVNFTNPNKKMEVRFEQLQIEVYFINKLIAAQAVKPFLERKRETRLEPIHMISSLVYLPITHATELMRQVENNKIQYEVKGTFKVRARFGMIHYSYSLHGRCQLQMTGPPTGILLYRNCTTKRQ